MCTNKVESSLPSILMEHNIKWNCVDSFIHPLFQYPQRAIGSFQITQIATL